jgi:CHAT domain-containing protein/tetratricopeptide (TPR) repeat protein
MQRHKTCRISLLVGFALLIALAFPARAADDAAQKQVEMLRSEGRYAEAITVMTRIIVENEDGPGLENPLGAALLNNLAELHYKLGRYAEAVPIYERALAIATRTGGANPATAITLRNLGTVYQLTRRPREAETMYQQSIEMLARFPNVTVQLASSLNNLATLYQDTGRRKEAEPLLDRVVKVYETALGRGHPYVATALSNLGQLYQSAGDLTKAKATMQEAHAIARAALGPDHPQVAQEALALARAHGASKDYIAALPLLRGALDGLQRQVRRGAQTREGQLGDVTTRELVLLRAVTSDFINTSMKVLTADQTNGVELVRQIFLAGQWRPSPVSQSLLAMSVRSLKSESPLAPLMRERQDLVAEWQDRNGRLMAQLTSPNMKAGSVAGVKEVLARLQAIDARIGDLDQRLTKEFPDYARLINPRPLEISEVQGLLHHNEALVVFLETPSPSWVWVITKTSKDLSLINVSSDVLAEEVARLRCGLDSQDWVDPSNWPEASALDARRKAAQAKRFRRCRSLAKDFDPKTGDRLPFDVGRAHAIYNGLLGSVAQAIAGKELLIVPSPTLLQLPFNVLVTEPAAGNALDFKKVKWLGTQSAISILPSVSTLAALRANARSSTAKKPYAGVGNPLLEGMPGSGQETAAALARSKQRCEQRVAATRAGAPLIRTPVASAAASGLTKGGLANVEVLRQQAPLPETADEVCDIAQRLGANDADLWLGARATETALKAASATGKLSDYRVVHFATHGLVAGILPGLAEPALLLTPPATPSEIDDGLLTASEVAQLKLNADWVILSACNTAAGGAEGAEVLSGLARAFFYAGTRSLLATHWEINSDAAVLLTTGAFANLDKEPAIGRSEALRRAMAALVADGERPWAPHPSIWAAFELIGEGAR